MMSDEQINQVMAWGSKPENFARLPLRDKAAALKALSDYQETVVPIFLRALARERNPDLKFFIKL